MLINLGFICSVLGGRAVLLEAEQSDLFSSSNWNSFWAKILLQLSEDVKITSGLDFLGWTTPWIGLEAKNVGLPELQFPAACVPVHLGFYLRLPSCVSAPTTAKSLLQFSCKTYKKPCTKSLLELDEIAIFLDCCNSGGMFLFLDSFSLLICFSSWNLIPN